MPLTFIDIERQKNWRIALFFAVLAVIYLAVALIVIAMLLLFGMLVNVSEDPPPVAGLLVIVFLAAGFHLWWTARNAVSTVIRQLSAEPPDEDDEVHRVLLNIMQELHVVTGNKRHIQCVVIPSLSLNALAAADLRGNAVIGITEGLLSRLSRPQLESVLAHEAHHILSGDCLESTVAASIFGAYVAAFEQMETKTPDGRPSFSILFLAQALLQLGNLLNMFISREREYRADAASVRMTRDPVALAEALYLLSRNWRGSGFISRGYEMMCIVNPEAAELDESEGFWADMFSTHPPIGRRIDLLLGMARIGIAELQARYQRRESGDPRSAAQAGPSYYAQDPQQQWQGPFSVAELATQPWLSPLTWISCDRTSPAVRAWADPVVNAVLLLQSAQRDPASSGLECPVCRQALARETCEGTRVDQCRFCSGMLVQMDRLPRILARAGRSGHCSDRILSLAMSVTQDNLSRHVKKKSSQAPAGTVPLYACPKCRNPMLRSFYSLAWLIEVDRCSNCGIMWFDRDELQMLQCLVEHRIAPRVPGAEPDSAGPLEQAGKDRR